MPVTNTQTICDYCRGGTDNPTPVAGPGTGVACPRCFQTHYRRCCACGDYWVRGDAVIRWGEFYCLSCCPTLSPFAPGAFEPTGQYMEVGSRRKYGIELETSRCPQSEDLIDSVWGAKHDCTVTGLEFVSPVLEGDGGFAAVHEFAAAADANGWLVDEDCGYHLHLDVRGRSRAGKFAIAYAFRATEDVWFSFVTDYRRRQSGYSCPCEWSAADLDRHYSRGYSFSEWAECWDRYNWINCQAYNDHGSLEIRNHEGTCDGEAICNWVKACTRFADWAERAGYEQVKGVFAECETPRECFEVIAEFAWKDSELAAYYAEKAWRLHGFTYLP